MTILIAPDFTLVMFIIKHTAIVSENRNKSAIEFRLGHHHHQLDLNNLSKSRTLILEIPSHSLELDNSIIM